jgi:peptide/nickel transport system ATP-binding protein
MLDLKRDLGLTYLYITHDLATARFLCDRIAIMYLGKIVEIGSADEVYENPRHPYTKSLLEAIPSPDPHHRIPRDLPRGEVPDATVPPLGCSFHPRCPRAFGPCGWESRDLRAIVEARWATLDPTEYQWERSTLGDLETLSDPTSEFVVPAGSHHSGTDVAGLLEALRATDPDEPMWRGIESMEPGPASVRIRFRRPVDPVLQPAGADGAEVACHLYREDLKTSSG